MQLSANMPNKQQKMTQVLGAPTTREGELDGVLCSQLPLHLSLAIRVVSGNNPLMKKSLTLSLPFQLKSPNKNKRGGMHLVAYTEYSGVH